MNLKQIDTIIFDLGNVLLDIDVNLSVKAFEDIGFKDFDKQYTLAAQSRLFDKLERGLISPHSFRKQLRTISGLQIPDKDIDQCWNSLLFPFAPTVFDLLSGLKPHFRLYLLSNTNQIHYRHYTADFRKQFGQEFDSMFNRAFYSFQMQKRKPNPDIFTEIIHTENILPPKSLFIDDLAENISTAAALDFRVLHKLPNIDLQTKLHEILHY